MQNIYVYEYVISYTLYTYVPPLQILVKYKITVRIDIDEDTNSKVRAYSFISLCLLET